MIVKTTISSLWLTSEPNIEKRLASIFDSAPEGTEMFFRADDVGVPGDNYRKMIEVFRKHQVPLHMAVTPAWLTHARWKTLKKWTGGDDLFCWHQHGWRHINHQRTGKKSEFGADRTKAEKKTDLSKGRAKLESIMGNDFQPFFTPPWNRFDSETGEALAELGYKAVSRSSGEQKKVPLPNTLPDIFINVDLHTRTETGPTESWNALINEFAVAIKTGRIGVMLHHQRMNGTAFGFLEVLLAMASKTLVMKGF